MHLKKVFKKKEFLYNTGGPPVYFTGGNLYTEISSYDPKCFDQ
jgi:hypothetical protein